MKEEELAKKFIAYYDKYDVYKEVPTGRGIVDIVVKDNNIITFIEVKTRLSFEVIEQAYYNRPYAHYTLIAVPGKGTHKFAHKVCKDYGIGVLRYNEKTDSVNLMNSATLNRHAIVNNLQLHDYMKRSVAGSQNTRITAFKNTIERMQMYIASNQGCTLKECLEGVEHHWRSLSSAKSSVYQWIKRGVIKEFFINEKGKLQLHKIPEHLRIIQNSNL